MLLKYLIIYNTEQSKQMYMLFINKLHKKHLKH